MRIPYALPSSLHKHTLQVLPLAWSSHIEPTLCRHQGDIETRRLLAGSLAMLVLTSVLRLSGSTAEGGGTFFWTRVLTHGQKKFERTSQCSSLTQPGDYHSQANAPLQNVPPGAKPLQAVTNYFPSTCTPAYRQAPELPLQTKQCASLRKCAQNLKHYPVKPASFFGLRLEASKQ